MRVLLLKFHFVLLKQDLCPQLNVGALVFGLHSGSYRILEGAFVDGVSENIFQVGTLLALRASGRNFALAR